MYYIEKKEKNHQCCDHPSTTSMLKLKFRRCPTSKRSLKIKKVANLLESLHMI
jgi:hypothetical protein